MYLKSKTINMVRVPCLKLVGDFSNSAKLQGKRVNLKYNQRYNKSFFIMKNYFSIVRNFKPYSYNSLPNLKLRSIIGRLALTSLKTV
jgi:hypothetical protein